LDLQVQLEKSQTQAKQLEESVRRSHTFEQQLRDRQLRAGLLEKELDQAKGDVL
jgi:hypothetical protein